MPVTTKTTKETFSGTGSQTTFQIQIEYDPTKTSDIKVEVNGVLKTETTHYTLSGVDLTFFDAPSSGTNNIKVYRDTSVDEPNASYAAGTSIRSIDLNRNQDQNLFATQELNNKVNDTLFTSSTAPTAPHTGTRWYDGASGRTYVWYDDGSSGQWVESSPPLTGSGSTASGVTFTQQGSSFTRTVDSKLKETISVKDFGAVGNGITDDIVAFKAATTYLNGLSDESIRELYIPPGKYHLSDVWTAPIHDNYKQCHVMGHGAVLDNTVLVGNASCLHGLTVDGSKDAGFVFTRGQWGYHEMLTAANCANGFYFGIASRQTLQVDDVTGFAIGNKITAGTTNETSEAFGYVVDIDEENDKLLLVRCNHNSVANLFRQRVARYTQDNNTGDGTGSAGTVVLITYTGHGLSDGDQVELKFRTGISGDSHAANGTYTVSNASTDTFKITSTQSALIEGSFDSTDNLGSYVRIIKNETITGDGQNNFVDPPVTSGTLNETATVSSVEFPYGANSQVTRVTFDNCGAHDISGSGFLIDGSNNGNNKNWFNANTTNGLSLVNCEGRSFKVRGFEGGAGGGARYNYNTHIGMNIEAGGYSNSLSDSIGRQNTYIGGHFVKKDAEGDDGVSVNMTGGSVYNYIYGGRYIGTVNINGNAQLFHKETGGAYGELNSLSKLTTNSIGVFESNGTTFIKDGWSVLPSAYWTKTITGNSSDATSPDKLTIDLPLHPNFQAGNGTDTYSSFKNNPHIFKVTIFGVRNNSNHASTMLHISNHIMITQDNNDASSSGYNVKISDTSDKQMESRAVTFDASNSGKFSFEFVTTYDMGSWYPIVEYSNLSGNNYSTP
jgi:hypothetical protein